MCSTQDQDFAPRTKIIKVGPGTRELLVLIETVLMSIKAKPGP